MNSHVAHHFDDAEQQFDSATLGMWIFLVTEVMFFGGLLAGYTVYRFQYPEAFVFGSQHLGVEIFGIETGYWLGAINTGVLLLSSLLVALSVHAAQVGNRRAIVRNLLITIVLGLVFLGIKAVEYQYKFAHHEVPGQHFKMEIPLDSGVQAGHVEIFFGYYFALTGLHAFHMVIGIVLVGMVVWQAHRGVYSAEYFTPVEIVGLYWHFVDIVWVFLFPLLYLIT